MHCEKTQHVKNTDYEDFECADIVSLKNATNCQCWRTWHCGSPQSYGRFVGKVSDSCQANPQILISPSSTLASENSRSLSLCCVHTTFQTCVGFDRGIVCVHSCYSHMFNCPKQQVYCTVHTLEHRRAIWRFLGGGPAPVDIIIIIMLLF